jgi:hypothetical protein
MGYRSSDWPVGGACPLRQGTLPPQQHAGRPLDSGRAPPLRLLRLPAPAADPNSLTHNPLVASARRPHRLASRRRRTVTTRHRIATSPHHITTPSAASPSSPRHICSTLTSRVAWPPRRRRRRRRRCRRTTTSTTQPLVSFVSLADTHPARGRETFSPSLRSSVTLGPRRHDVSDAGLAASPDALTPWSACSRSARRPSVHGPASRARLAPVAADGADERGRVDADR